MACSSRSSSSSTVSRPSPAETRSSSTTRSLSSCEARSSLRAISPPGSDSAMDKLYCSDMPDTTRSARLPAARHALLDSAIAVQWAHTVGSHGTPPVRAAALPQAPGVYRFRDRAGRVLYIGRAVSLRRRVLSYWGDLGDRAHLAPMVALIGRVEAGTRDSPHEAPRLGRNLLEPPPPPWNR